MLFIGTMVPFKVFSADLNNPEIQKLIAEKQQKIAALEKCSKKVKGFKIAGISTIGLTAVGVAGNIALSSKRQQVSGDLANARGKLLKKQQADDCNKQAGKKWNGEKCVDVVSGAGNDDNKSESEEVENNEYAVGAGVLVKDLDTGELYSEGTYDKCSVNNAGDWCAQISDDSHVIGVSACVDADFYTNEKDNEFAKNQNITQGSLNGKYCYCKMTHSGSTDLTYTGWVYYTGYDDSAECGHSCAFYCAHDFLDDSDFQNSLTSDLDNNVTNNDDSMDGLDDDEIGDRVVGGFCLDEDTPYKASVAMYIKLSHAFTKEKHGWESKRCWSDHDKTTVVDCSCAAYFCSSDDYVADNGLCIKKGIEKPKDLIPESQVDASSKSSFDVSRDGLGYSFKSPDGTYNQEQGNGCGKLKDKGDWCTRFDDYVIKGISKCDNGCFCGITSWQPNGGPEKAISADWVAAPIDNDCEVMCSMYCGDYTKTNKYKFREKLFETIK